MAEDVSMHGGSSTESVDMDLYSRQLGTYGLETMNKLMGLRVLISGLQGLGAETAKNLILAGPGKVTLHDSTVVDWPDLAANFCLKPEHVGKQSRAHASLPFLKELNSYVNVSVATGPLDAHLVAQHDVFVLCNCTKQQVEEVSDLCRGLRKYLIVGGAYGLCFSVFVDFGDEFKVVDTNGEQPKQIMVESIVEEDGDSANGDSAKGDGAKGNGTSKRLTINCVDDKRLPFEQGGKVELSDVDGFNDGLNGMSCEVLSVSKHSFVVERPASLSGGYVKGGVAKEVKITKVLKFRSFKNSCARPVPEGGDMLMNPKLNSWGRAEQLHIALQSLLDFEAEHQCIPEPRDDTACEAVYKVACELNEKYKVEQERGVQGVVCVDEVDRDVVTNVVSFAVCQISPIAAILGGIIAQEVIKVTGKYTPIHQWLYFDAFELLTHLPCQDEKDSATYQPTGSRHDDQVLIWGHKFQQKLADLNIFLVGAGALGCEYLKSFAMLGCSTNQGQVTVTDMDRIEVSNLNRQFLFRRNHVGSSKSKTAREQVVAMNDEMNVRAIETKVGQDTERELDDAFWDNLSVVVNALDNVPSRLYIDGKCVWHSKPLLESGTLGTKGNVQVIVPKKTESYADAQDPPEESIPLCTLKHFPNQIEHTLEWARDLFQGVFSESVQNANTIVQNREVAISLLKTQMGVVQRKEQLTTILKLLKITSFEDCVQAAADLFQENFNHAIAQLLHNFPEDHVTPNGVPFWSGTKKAPHVLKLNAEDPLHLGFMMAASNLLATSLGLECVRDETRVRSLCSQVKLQTFQPRAVVIKTDDSDTNAAEGGLDDEDICLRLESEILALLQARPNTPTLIPAEFEKDDDTNFHIDFMATAGNLRASNYNIPTVPRWRAKIIAGKIIPAIATTTAMVTGFASLELLKLLSESSESDRPVEEYCNTFANLALPVWVQSEPIGPPMQKGCEYDPIIGGPVRAKPDGFTTWDKVEVKLGPDGSLKEVIQKLETMFETEVQILTVGRMSLYNVFMRTTTERLEKPLKNLLNEFAQKDPACDPWKGYVIVQACCTDHDAVDVNIPVVKLILN